MSVEPERMTVAVRLSRSTPICLLLSLIRVIFELLWRDYFRFVAVKYGTKLFQVNGKISTSIDIVETVEMSVNLNRLHFRSSGQVCFLEKGHEAIQRMERLIIFSQLSFYLGNTIHLTGEVHLK